MQEVVISSKEDEQMAIDAARDGKVIITFTGDEIIPLENLISRLHGTQSLLVKVGDSSAAKAALEALELGADGVVLETDDPIEVTKTLSLLKEGKDTSLVEATVTEVRQLGLGARACIDTCTLMAEGSGMLVGSSSQGMMLVQAEVAQNEYVNPRPFRVNAGSLALYTQGENSKTCYLEELCAGDGVMLVDRNGTTSTSYVARSKIELRPLVLVVAEYQGSVAKAILQLAETVRIVQRNGSVAVTDIVAGDKILAHFECGGRHFGVHVPAEEVIEK